VLFPTAESSPKISTFPNVVILHNRKLSSAYGQLTNREGGEGVCARKWTISAATEAEGEKGTSLSHVVASFYCFTRKPQRLRAPPDELLGHPSVANGAACVRGDEGHVPFEDCMAKNGASNLATGHLAEETAMRTFEVKGVCLGIIGDRGGRSHFQDAIYIKRCAPRACL
jgi:hypothetical protein